MPHQLTYAGRRLTARQWMCRSAVFVVIAGLCGLAFYCGRLGLRELSFRREWSKSRELVYRECLKYEPDEKEKIFTGTCVGPGDRVWLGWRTPGTRLSRGLARCNFYASWGSREFFCESGLGDNDYLTLFLHRVQTPGGQERLMEITSGLPRSSPRFPSEIYVEVHSPGNRLRSYRRTYRAITVPFTLSPGDTFTFYYGQLDPANPSHVSLTYTAGTRRAIIDLWLRDDNQVSSSIAEQNVSAAATSAAAAR